jgi:hypothetical protein
VDPESDPQLHLTTTYPFLVGYFLHVVFDRYLARHYLVPGVQKSWCPLLKDPVTDELDDPHGHVEHADHLPQRHPTFWEQLLTLLKVVLESHKNFISVRPPCTKIKRLKEGKIDSWQLSRNQVWNL